MDRTGERGGHTEHRTHRLRGNVQLDNSAHAQIIPTQEAVQSKPFKPIGTKLQRGYGDTVGSKIQVYREVSFEFLLRALIRSINLYSSGQEHGLVSCYNDLSL